MMSPRCVGRRSCQGHCLFFREKSEALSTFAPDCQAYADLPCACEHVLLNPSLGFWPSYNHLWHKPSIERLLSLQSLHHRTPTEIHFAGIHFWHSASLRSLVRRDSLVLKGLSSSFFWAFMQHRKLQKCSWHTLHHCRVIWGVLSGGLRSWGRVQAHTGVIQHAQLAHHIEAGENFSWKQPGVELHSLPGQHGNMGTCRSLALHTLVCSGGQTTVVWSLPLCGAGTGGYFDWRWRFSWKRRGYVSSFTAAHGIRFLRWTPFFPWHSVSFFELLILDMKHLGAECALGFCHVFFTTRRFFFGLLVVANTWSKFADGHLLSQGAACSSLRKLQEEALGGTKDDRKLAIKLLQYKAFEAPCGQAILLAVFFVLWDCERQTFSSCWFQNISFKFNLLNLILRLCQLRFWTLCSQHGDFRCGHPSAAASVSKWFPHNIASGSSWYPVSLAFVQSARDYPPSSGRRRTTFFVRRRDPCGRRAASWSTVDSHIWWQLHHG